MTFDQAFDRIFKAEGGYVNDVNDPGGETNYGISKRAYPTLNIRTLTRDMAKEIYKRDFWDQMKGLSDVTGFQVFDFAVNSGMSTAIRYLQRAINVADDGHWGPVSQAALAAMDETKVILRFIAEKIEFRTRLSTWDSFSKGWMRRDAQNLRYAAEDL